MSSIVILKELWDYCQGESALTWGSTGEKVQTDS